ncbi:hypothetical protein MTO96_023110 [Rhipicephalus appendiculatus]
MELLRQFGDPHVLKLAKDHIVLKLETAWPPDVTLPEGISLANGDALLLVANKQSLIQAAMNTLPREAKISKALFCGCEAFRSSDEYRNAAVQLLRDTREICIMHNRNKVYNLIRMFPKARVIALPHDRCSKHALELFEPCRDPCAPLVQGCQLRELVGELDFGDVANIALTPKTVAVGSMESFAEIAAFRNLRSLFVMLSPVIANSNVNSHLKEVLTNSPDLDELVLEACGGLMFHTLATFCPRIKRMALANCTSSTSDTLVNEGAFPNLEYLAMSMQGIDIVAFRFLLRAVRETLRTASFDDDANSAEFLRYCVRWGRQRPFVNLENLTLATDQSLRALKLEHSDLHDVTKGLPALRHLQTNSYDLRLFFENCVPRGRVSLSWLGCVCCESKDPNEEEDEEMVTSGEVRESTPASATD